MQTSLHKFPFRLVVATVFFDSVQGFESNHWLWLSATDSPHELATTVQQRINTERLATQPSPGQPGRVRPFSLIQQDKDSDPCSVFCPRRKQSKISHRMPTAIRNMLHQKADEFFIRIVFVNELLISSVLRQI